MCRLRASKFGYLIGGLHYSLSEMENGIIRGNRKPQRVFQQKDPRLAYASTTFDPHLHFLLGWMGSSTELPIRIPKLYTHVSLMSVMQVRSIIRHLHGLHLHLIPRSSPSPFHLITSSSSCIRNWQKISSTAMRFEFLKMEIKKWWCCHGFSIFTNLISEETGLTF